MTLADLVVRLDQALARAVKDPETARPALEALLAPSVVDRSSPRWRWLSWTIQALPAQLQAVVSDYVLTGQEVVAAVASFAGDAQVGATHHDDGGASTVVYTWTDEDGEESWLAFERCPPLIEYDGCSPDRWRQIEEDPLCGACGDLVASRAYHAGDSPEDGPEHLSCAPRNLGYRRVLVCGACQAPMDQCGCPGPAGEREVEPLLGTEIARLLGEQVAPTYTFCEPCGKRGYTSEDDAKSAHRASGDRLRFYSDAPCGLWHATSQAESGRHQKARARKKKRQRRTSRRKAKQELKKEAS